MHIFMKVHSKLTLVSRNQLIKITIFLSFLTIIITAIFTHLCLPHFSSYNFPKVLN